VKVRSKSTPKLGKKEAVLRASMRWVAAALSDRVNAADTVLEEHVMRANRISASENKISNEMARERQAECVRWWVYDYLSVFRFIVHHNG
jgi:hypothetical protein